jgi:hypothetical protein
MAIHYGQNTPFPSLAYFTQHPIQPPAWADSFASLILDAYSAVRTMKK